MSSGTAAAAKRGASWWGMLPSGEQLPSSPMPECLLMDTNPQHRQLWQTLGFLPPRYKTKSPISVQNTGKNAGTCGHLHRREPGAGQTTFSRGVPKSWKI